MFILGRNTRNLQAGSIPAGTAVLLLTPVHNCGHAQRENLSDWSSRCTPWIQVSQEEYQFLLLFWSIHTRLAGIFLPCLRLGGPLEAREVLAWRAHTRARQFFRITFQDGGNDGTSTGFCIGSACYRRRYPGVRGSLWSGLFSPRCFDRERWEFL